MRLEVPKLRLWHLLGLIAAGAAFFSVMRFRQETEEPAYRWIRQLRAIRVEDRREAVQRLAQIRPSERRAIAPLMEALFDSDAKVRGYSARALSGIVQGDKKDPEFETVKAALASRLSDPDPFARREIAFALTGYQPEPGLIVPILLAFADDPDSYTRHQTINRLGFYARESETARRAVFKGLDDPDQWVRLVSVSALASCSTFPNLAPEPLLGMSIAGIEEATGDESAYVRRQAVTALGGLASRLKREMPGVIKALADPDPEVRLAAVVSLRWRVSGRRSPDLIPALARALGDKEVSIRRASAEALGRIGYEVDAEAALASLRASANDSELEVRQDVAKAIAAIEKASSHFRDHALPEAIALLGDADPIVRSLAASQLGGFGPKAAKAVPALVRALGDRDAVVRRTSAEALGLLGPSAALAVPDLTTRADSDEDENVRRASSLSRSILLGEGQGEAHAP